MEIQNLLEFATTVAGFVALMGVRGLRRRDDRVHSGGRLERSARLGVLVKFDLPRVTLPEFKELSSVARPSASKTQTMYESVPTEVDEVPYL